MSMESRIGARSSPVGRSHGKAQLAGIRAKVLAADQRFEHDATGARRTDDRVAGHFLLPVLRTAEPR